MTGQPGDLIPGEAGTKADSSQTLPQPQQPRGHNILGNAQKRWAKRYRTEISASSASLLSTLAAFPLDSVKTRMQTYKFHSFTGCVRHTYRTEGLHGFWRGVWAPLVSITLVRTISFSIYQKTKYKLDEWIYQATGQSPLVIANTRDALPTLSTVLCFGTAGATSGLLITLLSCPFELTKLSAQIAVLMERGIEQGHVKPSDRYYPTAGTWETARKIIREKGIRGIYAGFYLHALRDTVGTAIYFMTYESSKQLLANARGNSPTSPVAVVTAGGLCGLVSWACIYPIDSAKSIYQRNVLSSPSEKTPKTTKIQYTNVRMYRGLGVSMTRSCLINAIFFSWFEFTKKQINHLEVD